MKNISKLEITRFPDFIVWNGLDDDLVNKDTVTCLCMVWRL